LQRNEVIITAVKVIISIILLLIIVFLGNPITVIEQLIRTGLLSLIPLIVLYYSAFILSGLRLKILVSSMVNGSNYSIKDAITTHFASTFLADYTPGGAGYVYGSRAISSKTNLTMKNGLVIIVLCFLIDVSARSLLSILSMVIDFMLIQYNQLGIIIVICSVAVIALISYILFFKGTIDRSIVVYGNKSSDVTKINFIPSLIYKYLSRLEKKVNSTENDSQIAIQVKDLYMALVVSLTGWFITGIRFWLTLLILGEPSSFIITCGVLPIVALVSFLPISLGNLGTLDLSYFGILVFSGISPGVAATFVLIDRCLTVVLDFPGYFFLIGNEMSG